MRDLEYTREDEIADISVQRPHLVIVGAGASRAALPNGDRNGKQLPVMADFARVLNLDGSLSRHGFDCQRNFEELYAEIAQSSQHESLMSEINNQIDDYFLELQLPEEPTLYDSLVLSLRQKDIVATFNWDPFLVQAAIRNRAIAEPPRLLFLHGNVAIGYCLKDRVKGYRSTACSNCRKLLAPSRLLYPVTTKGYTQDPFTELEWRALESALGSAFYLTIFGYGAPQADVEAIDIMKKAWGDVSDRNMEQTEMIDVKPQDELLQTWRGFVHTHHYDTWSDFYESWIALHPRRSCEAAFAQFYGAKFVETNPLPRVDSFSKLWQWFEPLIAVERR